MKKIISIFIGIFMTVGAFAQGTGGNATNTASAGIVYPLKIETIQDLDFGVIALGHVPGECETFLVKVSKAAGTGNYNGLYSMEQCAKGLGGAKVAVFKVTAANDSTMPIHISAPDFTLTGPSGSTLTGSLGANNQTGHGCDAGAGYDGCFQTMSSSGTISANGSQILPGTYTGTYTVTVSY